MKMLRITKNYDIKCSPIVNFKGRDVFLVNVSLFDPERSKYCGIQFPQKHVSYRSGFSEDEVRRLIAILSQNEDNLWDEARIMLPLPDDIPLDDLGFM